MGPVIVGWRFCLTRKWLVEVDYSRRQFSTLAGQPSKLRWRGCPVYRVSYRVFFLAPPRARKWSRQKLRWTAARWRWWCTNPRDDAEDVVALVFDDCAAVIRRRRQHPHQVASRSTLFHGCTGFLTGSTAAVKTRSGPSVCRRRTLGMEAIDDRLFFFRLFLHFVSDKQKKFFSFPFFSHFHSFVCSLPRRTRFFVFNKEKFLFLQYKNLVLRHTNTEKTR